MGNLAIQEARPDSAAAEVHTAQALELRIAGGSYRVIARELRVSVNTAHRYVVHALGDVRQLTAERAHALRVLDSERLDSLLLQLWPKRSNPRVVDSILRILERRAKLWGLDAPTRMQWHGPSAGSSSGGRTAFDLSRMPTELLERLEAIQIELTPYRVAVADESAPDVEGP